MFSKNLGVGLKLGHNRADKTFIQDEIWLLATHEIEYGVCPGAAFCA